METNATPAEIAATKATVIEILIENGETEITNELICDYCSDVIGNLAMVKSPGAIDTVRIYRALRASLEVA